MDRRLGGDSFCDWELDIKPLGEAPFRNLDETRVWRGDGSAVESEAFEVKFEGLTEVGAHLLEGVTGAGAAWDVGREAAHVGWAVLVDDEIWSSHGFNPAYFRIL